MDEYNPGVMFAAGISDPAHGSTRVLCVFVEAGRLHVRVLASTTEMECESDPTGVSRMGEKQAPWWRKIPSSRWQGLRGVVFGAEDTGAGLVAAVVVVVVVFGCVCEWLLVGVAAVVVPVVVAEFLGAVVTDGDVLAVGVSADAVGFLAVAVVVVLLGVAVNLVIVAVVGVFAAGEVLAAVAAMAVVAIVAAVIFVTVFVAVYVPCPVAVVATLVADEAAPRIVSVVAVPLPNIVWTTLCTLAKETTQPLQVC